MRISPTPNGEYIIATGVYKPQFRVYDLSEMAMKFERHTDAETVTFQILSEDWKKLVLLQADRSIEFHSPCGMYHSVKIPKMGRDMIYDYNTCDMLVGASSNQVYRLNLDRGQFLAPFETNATGINVAKVAPLHSLYAFGGDGGVCEFWDRRVRERIGSMTICSPINPEETVDVTAMNFMPDGMHWSVGTSDGRVLLFDLRSAKPLAIRDHYNGFAIKKIEYHSGSQQILSADKKSIKMWSFDAGEDGSGPSTKVLTTIEPSADINDFSLFADSGLVMVGIEDKAISSYFVPALGAAPSWCTFLENLTEEMEEKAPQAASVYDNYKFVTRAELSQLGLEHLIGTALLRAYMHGFFVDFRLYEKAKAIANPFAYEEYREKQRQAKINQARESRIRAVDAAKSIPKVNPKLASRLQALAEKDDDAGADEELNVGGGRIREKKTEKKLKKTASILTDDRFKELFKNPEYEIDEDSFEFKFLHPSTKPPTSSK